MEPCLWISAHTAFSWISGGGFFLGESGQDDHYHLRPQELREAQPSLQGMTSPKCFINVTKHSLLTYTFSLDARKSFNSTSNKKVHEHITLFFKVLKFCHINDSALTAVKKKSKQTMFFCLFVRFFWFPPAYECKAPIGNTEKLRLWAAIQESLQLA